ncbi:NADPH:quinone reductase [Halalkalibacter akibai]|uniref:Zinc-containing alcohol dehydrogenase n=1 Tax=Halalkalibacter akibai (strain ATCC 43226 / DSM 21942 / CIP 109018 / JCM 9157 / 1139) TaxID=1236973 RepID=W4QZI5_HALA3|nr:NADPH:quinone reductase [Halalkalibacter akibai]GAE37540.1 zinc-containing alcohol dehydrogenase [Halalkalibacter akibai JCM 9157]
MKAVIYEAYGDPNVLKVAEIEKPSIKPNQVLVNVKASGINPVDTYFRKGIRQVEAFPNVPHFDLAGEVVEVGNAVDSVQVGDRVWATNAKGASAEFVALNSEAVFPLPAHLSYEDGAALAMPYMTAYLSLFNRGNLKEDETVLVYGAAGAVGHAAVQLAKNAGATVIATASNKEKAQIAKDAGADHVINYTEEDLVKQALEVTDQKGVSLILDMSVSENMEKNLEMIQLTGRIITIGSPVNNMPPLLWRQLNMKHASLTGVLLFTAPPAELKEAGKAISKGFSENLFRSHVGKVFSYQEAAAAHETLESKTVNGRIILSHEG